MIIYLFKIKMKKFIITLGILLISISGFCFQDVSKDSISDKQSKELTEQIYSDVKSVITGLAKELKVGAENVYAVIKSQQVVKSTVNIIKYVLLILMLILGIKGILIGYKYCSTDSYGDKDLDHPLFIFSSVATIPLLAISISMFSATITETITGFINPDFGAINYILQLIK